MNEEYRRDELTRSAESLRQLQQDQPQVFDQILNDINTDQKTRDAVTPDELAASSPALEDLNRSSPEALLGLFLLLKGAAKGEGRK